MSNCRKWLTFRSNIVGFYALPKFLFCFLTLFLKRAHCSMGNDRIFVLRCLVFFLSHPLQTLTSIVCTLHCPFPITVRNACILKIYIKSYTPLFCSHEFNRRRLIHKNCYRHCEPRNLRRICEQEKMREFLDCVFIAFSGQIFHDRSSIRNKVICSYIEKAI